MLDRGRSGRLEAFQTIDAVRYVAPAEAVIRILPGQRPLLDNALARLGV